MNVTQTEQRIYQPLPKEDKEWLKRLQTELWSLPPHGMRNGCATVTRHITHEELERTYEIVNAYGLPCELRASGPIYGFTLHIYEHAPVPGVAPEQLIVLDDGHYPLREKATNRWARTWRAFAEFSNTPENTRLVQFYGLQPPKDMQHYEF